MRVIIDYDMCEGHAMCVLAAPEVFEVGSDDRAVILNALPGEQLRHKVESAVRSCPKQALKIED